MHTVDILLDTGEVNGLYTSDLLSRRNRCAGSGRSGRGIEGRNKGAAGWSTQLLCQWGAKSSGECAGSHVCMIEWSGCEGREEVKVVCVFGE